jgi:Cu/Ag efflux protein CusF
MSKYLMRAVAASSLIAVALAFTLPVQAQESTAPAKPKPHHLTGAIESIDVKANTVTVKQTVKQKEESKTFKVSDQTKYSTAEKKTAALSDLKVGDKVTVSYTEESGALIAQKIAPPAEKKAK